MCCHLGCCWMVPILLARWICQVLKLFPATFFDVALGSYTVAITDVATGECERRYWAYR